MTATLGGKKGHVPIFPHSVRRSFFQKNISSDSLLLVGGPNSRTPYARRSNQMVTEKVQAALSGSNHFSITIAPNEDGRVVLKMSRWSFEEGKYVETPYLEEDRDSLHETMYIAGYLIAKRMDECQQIPADLRQRPGNGLDNERHWHSLFKSEIRGYGRE